MCECATGHSMTVCIGMLFFLFCVFSRLFECAVLDNDARPIRQSNNRPSWQASSEGIERFRSSISGSKLALLFCWMYVLAGSWVSWCIGFRFPLLVRLRLISKLSEPRDNRLWMQVLDEVDVLVSNMCMSKYTSPPLDVYAASNEILLRDKDP